MKPLFAASLTAMRDQPLPLGTRVEHRVAVYSESREVYARARPLNDALTTWPKAEGWHDHLYSLVEVPFDMVEDAYLSAKEPVAP